jgi:hypothetical protein
MLKKLIAWFIANPTASFETASTLADSISALKPISRTENVPPEA